MTTVTSDSEAPTAPETTSASDEQPAPTLLWRPCEVCGERIAPDQDWCLECGSARRGRIGARTGWRAGFTVVGLTLLLLTGAVAASYAALTGDAQRDASRPSAGSGQPVVAQAPGSASSANSVTPGATGPGTTAPPPRVAHQPAIGSHPSAATSAPAAAGAPGHSSSGAAAGGGSSSSGRSSSSHGSSTSGPKTIKLAANSATTYDPSKRVGAEFGPAANAVDASPQSVWDVTVPADKAPIGAGLVIDLGRLYTVDSLKIDTPTPGFDVEIYGAKSAQIPPRILDARWAHLLTVRNYADGSSISLKGHASGKLRYVNLWLTAARNADDPRIAIANVAISATK